jgi:hypothetical protein
VAAFLWGGFVLVPSFGSGTVSVSFGRVVLRFGLPSSAGDESFGAAVARLGLPSAAAGEPVDAISAAILFPRGTIGEFCLLPLSLRLFCTRGEFCLLPVSWRFEVRRGEADASSTVKVVGKAKAAFAKLARATAWA